MVRRSPSPFHPLRHASRASHGPLQIPQEHARARNLSLDRIHHPRKAGKVLRICPHVGGSDEKHNGRRHLCADERNVGGKALGIPAGLSWRRHPWHGIASELKNDHGRWMGFNHLFPILVGDVVKQGARRPAQGDVVDHHSLVCAQKEPLHMLWRDLVGHAVGGRFVAPRRLHQVALVLAFQPHAHGRLHRPEL